ncbi:hypothetical protein ACJMK2_007060 [Sinanodonta woodiana]|uniref:Uncharacterized protein n=1 Tax=Sinanodonta woodiana TaxID=1069815 RepID=A0ABD3VIJ5_SINWO
MATDIQLVREFKSIGKDHLGYQGQQLAEFIERSLSEHKQQVARIQAEEKAREKELELARIQAEEKAKEKELELARIQAEAEEKAREREHTLAMERLRLEVEFRIGEESNERPESPSRRLEDRRPIQISMPMFNDKEEIVDNFLTQFEKLALIQ